MAEQPPDGWSETEQRLWRAFRRGERVDLRTGDPAADDPSHASRWPEARTVRATVVERLLLNGPGPEPGHSCKLDLLGARTSGEVDLSAARVECPVKLMHCSFGDRLLLDYAEVGWLNLDGSHLRGIDAEGLRIGLWFGMRGAQVLGEVWLHDARISGGADLSGSSLHGSPGLALMGKQMVVEGDLRLRGIRTTGTLHLARSRVSGSVDLTGARLTARGEDALDLEDLQARRVVLGLLPASHGRILLRGSITSSLAADPGAWPAGCPTVLEGATFDALEPVASCPATERMRWLRLHVPEVSPPVYEQVAASYRRAGQEQQARLVLMHKERLRYRAMGPVGRLWGRLLDRTVGFGHKPSRAFVPLAALLVLGTMYFRAAGPPGRAKTGEGPAWDPFIYVLDLVVPIVNLGHDTAWDPAGWAKAVALTLVMSGWVLATAIAAGATRILNRQ